MRTLDELNKTALSAGPGQAVSVSREELQLLVAAVALGPRGTDNQNYVHPRVAILHEGAKLTAGDRDKEYGPPSENMACAGDLKATFRHYLARVMTSAELEAIDMALTKISRLACGKPKRDTYVDAATYIAIAGECALYPSGRPQTEQGHADWRGTGEGRAGPGDTLRRKIGPTPERYDDRGRPQSGGVVSDKRVLDPAQGHADEEQRSGDHLHASPGVEGGEPISDVTRGVQDRQQGPLSATELQFRTRSTDARNYRGQPQFDRMSGRYRVVGFDGEAEHIIYAGNNTDVAAAVHEAIREALANLSSSGGITPVGPATYSDRRPNEGQASSGVPGNPTPEPPDHYKPHSH